MKTVEVEIEDISYDGAGVAKIGGKIVFVAKALPGEVVRARIVKERSKFCVALPESILRPNEHRREAFCPHFGICGGCDFQNTDPEYEKELKTEILRKELSKVGYCGKIGFVAAPDRKHYRNKLKLEFCGGKLGYFRPGTHDFFEISTCPIAGEKLLDALEKVKNFLGKIFAPGAKGGFAEAHGRPETRARFAAEPLEFFGPFGPGEEFCAGLKNVYLKEADNGVGICFLFETKRCEKFLKNRAKFEEFIKKCEKTQKNAEILLFFHQFFVFFAFGDVLENNKTKVFAVGQNKKPQKIFGGLTFENDISAFNQINDRVAEKLYDFVAERACGRRVVNAYSGQGLLTALLAQKAEKVFGIEYQKSAHQAAEKLCQTAAKAGGYAKPKNICGKAEEELPKLLRCERVDSVVLDPAREGCAPAVLQAVLDGKIPKVVYISCNFATLTRDLAMLLPQSAGYKISDVQIFDMFPCTANMETVVVLERGNPCPKKMRKNGK